MLQSLEDYEFNDNTLQLFVSDNGSPFPNAKTNLYKTGMNEPMMISNSLDKSHWGKEL